MPGLLDILLGCGVDFGAGIGGDLVPGGANQSMDRHPGGLAGYVPQCHVAGADSAHGDGAAGVHGFEIGTSAGSGLLQRDYVLGVEGEGGE